ncbi:MAG TPA: hypothetical protein VJG32_13140 [Anaerolineae bacterium]|nr:hypothetical protein [Anaerolineae bacterium]
MTLSQLARLLAALCAGVWLAAPSLLSPVTARAPEHTLLTQDSPLTGPFGDPPDSPLPTPARCSADQPCEEELSPTPSPEFQTFLPGVSEPAAPSADAGSQPPPDLGTVLNYVAVGVIVVGVTLKAYWFVADRRKGIAE